MLTDLFLSVCHRFFERSAAVRNSTNLQITVLSIETTQLEPLETVSNSLADTVLIKTGSGNGDLESSQWRIGRPGENSMVSVVARNLAFLTEIFGAGVADAEKAQNVGQKRKTPGVDLSSSGVNFLEFLP
jgi:hypothetical protein